MKHIYRKLTALAAAAITAVSALSATGLTASAYPVTSSNVLSLTNQYNGAGAGYCWSTKKQQDGLPMFNLAYLQNRSSVTAKYAGEDTMMFATLSPDLMSKNTLATGRKQIDKITVRDKKRVSQSYGLKLEYDPCNKNLNQFALRMMSDYHLKPYLQDYMYFDEDSFTFDYEGNYSGRICFDDLYVAGLRLSSSDGYTTFSEPVIEWEDGWYNVYVEFSGQLPSPYYPIYEGVYDRFMTRSDFDDAYWMLMVCNYRMPAFYTFDIPILTDLKVTYNGCNTPFITDEFEKIVYELPVGVNY